MLGSFFPFNSTFVQVALSFSITTDKRSLKKLPGLSSSSSESSSISSRSWTPPKNRTLLVPGTPMQEIPLLGTGLAPICFTVCHFHLLKGSSCSEIIQIILVKLATLSYWQCLEIRIFKGTEKYHIFNSKQKTDAFYLPKEKKRSWIRCYYKKLEKSLLDFKLRARLGIDKTGPLTQCCKIILPITLKIEVYFWTKNFVQVFFFFWNISNETEVKNDENSL